jgi:hypothetical protein
LLSILALDAYNRGSAVELANQDKKKISSVISPATVSKKSDDVLDNGAIAIGFSATSYTLADGKTTVIAYRGTDAPGGTPDSGSDAWHGWTLATGGGSSFMSGNYKIPNSGLAAFLVETNAELSAGRGAVRACLEGGA